jgi:hypothetical protein
MQPDWFAELTGPRTVEDVATGAISRIVPQNCPILVRTS